jgi:mRNA interferase MazF
MIDFGMAAKVRPALLLTNQATDDELDIVTMVLHTTTVRGNRWELSIPKPFLKPGAFHLQQVQTVSTVKLERKLGTLTRDEMDRLGSSSSRLRTSTLQNASRSFLEH